IAASEKPAKMMPLTIRRALAAPDGTWNAYGVPGPEPFTNRHSVASNCPYAVLPAQPACEVPSISTSPVISSIRAARLSVCGQPAAPSANVIRNGPDAAFAALIAARSEPAVGAALL